MQRASIVMMANDQATYVRKITAKAGLALAKQLEEWRHCALKRLNENMGTVTQAMLVADFIRDLGTDHPLYTWITDPHADKELYGRSAQEVATTMCNIGDEEFVKRIKSLGEEDVLSTEFAIEINDAYPAYMLSSDDEESRRELMQIIARDDIGVADWRQAGSDLRVLEEEIARKREIHENRTLVQKCRFLSSDPKTAKLMEEIKESVKLADTMRRSTESQYRATKLPIPHERQQFRTVDCMTGLTWLTRYALYRGGGMSAETLTEFRSQRMQADETPSAAVNRVYNMADVLMRTGIRGLAVDYELNELITNPNLKGGAFFTNTLHRIVFPMVRSQLAAERIDALNDPKAYRAVYTHWANEIYMDIHGSRSADDLAICAELKDRRSLNPNGTGVYDLGKGKQGATDGASGSGAKTPQKGAQQKAQEKHPDQGDFKHYCAYHKGNNTHGTDACYKIKQLVEQEEAGGEARRAMTTTSAPGQNPTDKGTRPNTRYARGSDQSNDPSRQSPVRCDVCTKVVGKAITHRPDQCFLDPEVPVEEWFNPYDEGRRAIINKKREKKGLGPLEPFKPRANPAVEDNSSGQANAHEHIEVRRAMMFHARFPVGMDNTGRPTLHPDDPTLRSINERNPVVPTTSVTDDFARVNNELEFNSVARKFECKVCHGRCEEKQRRDGMLTHVECVHCSKRWQPHQLPPAWVDPVLWGKSIESSGLSIYQQDFALPKENHYEHATDSIYGGVRRVLGMGTVASSQASISFDRTQQKFPSASGLGQVLIHNRVNGALSVGNDSDPAMFPFASNKDQLTFFKILKEILANGKPGNVAELERIYASLSPESRRFHAGRVQKNRQRWAELCAHAYGDDGSPDQGGVPLQTPIKVQEQEIETPWPVANEVVDAKPMHETPTVLPAPAAEPQSSRAAAHTGQRPLSSLSSHDAFAPVAHLVTVDQVASQMSGILSMQYVPRSEFAQLSGRLDATNNDVTRVKDSIKTIQQAATITAFTDSQTHVAGKDLISIRSAVGKVKEIAEGNTSAIAKLTATPVDAPSGSLKVEISDVIGRLDQLSASDVDGLPVP